MKTGDPLPEWMHELREYREDLAGMRVAEVSGRLAGIRDRLSENSHFPPGERPAAETLSAIDNLGAFIEKKETERLALEAQRAGAEEGLASALGLYGKARTERLVLERLVDRRQKEARVAEKRKREAL